jgi:excisionase family DNA binding protein
MNNEPYVNLKVACAFLGLKERTVRTLIAARKIPFYRYSYQIMFKLSELEVWVQKHKVDESEPGPVQCPVVG